MAPDDKDKIKAEIEALCLEADQATYEATRRALVDRIARLNVEYQGEDWPLYPAHGSATKGRTQRESKAPSKAGRDRAGTPLGEAGAAG